MMRAMKRWWLAVGVLLVVARTSSASVCVSLDESRDTLSPEDRRAAAISFGQSLAKNGVAVGQSDCTVMYTFYNVKLGDAITVYVVGPTGATQARAAKLDELPLTYDQLARSLVTGQPIGSDLNTDRTNVTTDQMAPRRIAADDLKYVRLGYGIVTGPTTASGAAFGFGWRHELDRLAIEVSIFDLVFASSNDAMGNGQSGVSGDLIKLSGYWYQQPLANTSMYYGLGVGYGVNALCATNLESGGCYAGSGLEGVLSAGYEMLRSSTIRFIVQVDAALPTFTSNGTYVGGTVTHRWVPSLGLSVGLGWGRSNTVRVVAN
jgi:hypothetical protein